MKTEYEYNYDKMTLKNAVTKGVKAWRDRRVGYWLRIDPKTGEYYLPTSANSAESNGLKAMYRLPAVYYRAVSTRDWNVKLGPHVIGTHLDTSAYIKDLDGFFDRIKESNRKTVIFMAFEEAKQQAIDRSEWVLCLRTETITIYSYSELSEEAWEPDYAFGIEATEYLYAFYRDADPEIEEIGKPEPGGYIRHCSSLFEPTEGKVFGNVIEECLEAFFSACCQDVEYTQSQEYFTDFTENNELEFYENDICVRHR